MYRAYTLNGVDHIENAVWIEADDDREAIAKAREMTQLSYEIRERARLVARVDASGLLRRA